MSFAGKVVLITGASSGIGADVAVHFARLGANVAINGRNATNLNATAENTRKAGNGKVLSVVGDVSKESDVKALVDATIKEFGRLDVLVNNAGFTIPGTIDQVKLSDFDTVFNTNVRGVYYLTSLAVPHLIKTKGSIVNVSSVAGLRVFPGASVYCMSKAALDQFTKCIALELAPKGVRVNSVNPAVIITEFHKRAGQNDKEYEAFLEHSKETHAMGRVGTVDEVSKAIAFLASDNASFTTGALLNIDGGKYLMCPR